MVFRRGDRDRLLGGRRDRRQGRGGSARAVLVGLALLLVAWGGLATFRTGGKPEVAIRPELPGIGRRTPVAVTVSAGGRGLFRIEIALVQGGDGEPGEPEQLGQPGEPGQRVEALADRAYRPRPAWAFWGPRATRDRLEVVVGTETITGLESGDAEIVVRAWPAPTWLRRPAPVVGRVTLPVRLAPPSLAVLSSQHYVAQGGSEVVVYRVGETAARSGVRSGGEWFPGFPLPGGGPRDRFALFGIPFDADEPSKIRLQAFDDVRNVAESAFTDKFTPRPPQTDTIELTTEFMAKVVPEILSRTPGLADRGSLLDNYLMINGELRRRNAALLEELAAGSRREFLWSEEFLAMPNAQVMSAFADRRTYVFDGKEVDRQVHLGFDLASTERAPVPASNQGVVVLASYLGIYGNAVVLDHGYGLMSLYGHLSSIDVEEGETVERGATLGRTGATGLAGGDHLHFTILLHGVPVNPIEWWDPRWIDHRLRRKLGRAMTAAPAG